MKRFLFLISLMPILFSCSGKQDLGSELRSEADLAGHRVATVAGCVYDVQLAPREDISLQVYNSNSAMLQALVNGVADVTVHDETIFNAQVRLENGIKIAFKGEQAFPTGFMFSKEDVALAQFFTDVQRQMEADGSMERLIDLWLSDRPVDPDSLALMPEERTGPPLRVATCTAAAPISFPVGEEWYGLEIDILREVAKQLDRPLEIKFYDPSSGFMAIRSGQADVLSGGVFITPERQEEFLFAEPYHAFHPAYYIKDPDALKDRPVMQGGLRSSIRKNLVTENRWKLIAKGLWETVKISLLAILLGTLLGAGLYAMTRSRRGWIRAFAQGYKSFMAGIPELVLLLILFYVVFAGSPVPPYLVAVICFALFFASGVCDIFRTSLDAIPHGQTEAGLALGFTPAQTFFHIVLPQAVRHGLPLYKGLCISLLKGTSIVGYIAIQDLTRAGDIIRGRTFDAFIPLLVVSLIYFLLVWLIGLLLKLAAPKAKVL